jgi:hypothetical protein
MFGQLFSAAGSRRQMFEAMVRHVAAASVDVVRSLVIDRAIGMGPTEARGYIRGRGGLEVRKQTRLALSRHADVDPEWETLMAQRAADRVAATMLRELGTGVVRSGATSRRVG